MNWSPRLPAVETTSRHVSADQLEAWASAWHMHVDAAVGGDEIPVAALLPASTEGVALLAALTARRGWLLLLPPDPQLWTPALGVPPGLPIVLPPPSLLPTLAGAGDASASAASIAAANLRGVVHQLPELPAAIAAGTPPLDLLRSAGVVLFTSGSTGTPRPVFRSMASLVAGNHSRLTALGLKPGDGLIVGTSLSHGHGLTRTISAMLLGGAFALLDPLDHHAALEMLARPQYQFWSATPHFADLLGRCALTAPPIVPPVCLVSAPVSEPVFTRFTSRFGVPLRQNYSSTETGVIAAEIAPDGEVRPGTVGPPLPGVEVRVGEDAGGTAVDGLEGRLWIRSPWLMTGYGVPPHLDLPLVDGWWGTRDVGYRRADGRLVLSGRLDDNVRTREGRLVNLADIAARLRELEGVTDAAVVPITLSAGASFGAVIQCGPATSLSLVRGRITAALPRWAWPRALVSISRLPRLTSGKVDRLACITLLQEHAS